MIDFIKGYKFRRNLANGIIYFILGVMCIIWILPFLYLVLHSLRLDGAVMGNDAILPKQLTFRNYVYLFSGQSGNENVQATLNFPRWFLNTLIVAACSCVISTLSVLMVSYTFSRLRFGIRKTLMNIAMILGMFPGFMTMIAMYYLLQFMGLQGQLVALVLCYSCGAGLGFQISKGFFDTIPRALDEAATIDGATRNQIFWKIILPMSKPIVVYTVLTSFIGPWTDFILAKIIMADKLDNYTVAIGLWKMLDINFKATYYQQFLAGSVVVAVPITLVFLKMQKYYVEGVTAGGVKG